MYGQHMEPSDVAGHGDSSGSTRRKLFAASVAAAAGTGLTFASRSRSQGFDEDPGTFGVIVSNDGRGELRVESHGDGRIVTIRVPADANLARVGPARLSDFDVGDPVCVIGHADDDGTVVAQRVYTVPDLVVSRVEQNDPGRLRTAVGPVAYDDATKAVEAGRPGRRGHVDAREPEEARAGDRAFMYILRNRRTRSGYLQVFGVKDVG